CSRNSPSWTRRTNSASLRNQYSRPFSSPRRCRRVVAETATSSSGTRSSSAWISVPFPAPEGPVTTKTGLPVEEANQLGALAIRQAPDRLRLADPALVEEARGLDAAELRHRHQHVEHLRGRDVLGRGIEDVLDLNLAQLQVLLQLRPAHADVVRPGQSFHPLIERANRRRRLCLGRHRASESNSLVPAVKRGRLRTFAGIFSTLSTPGRGVFSPATALHARSRPRRATTTAHAPRARRRAPRGFGSARTGP